MDLHDGLSSQIEQLLAGESADPHAVLGCHSRPEGGFVIRAFNPEARGVALCIGNELKPMRRFAPGLFVCGLDVKPERYRLRFEFDDGAVHETDDPYRFSPTVGEIDEHLFGEGSHRDIHRFLGAHPRTIDGVAGVSFAVWAPAALRVSVVGEFNHWDGRKHPMRRMGMSGVWELFIPGIPLGALYKFEVKTQERQLRLKTDPVAFEMELRPGTASLVRGLGSYAWHDESWLSQREAKEPRKQPLSIYEVHLGSWRRKADGGWLSYRELAPLLVSYCQEHQFTHIELLPIAEHAYDPSWGYQTTGFFAPTSRFGSPDDLRYLINYCHSHGLGVLLDWVPAHFPKDDFALRRFDGTALYEHSDPREGEHRDWGTLIFNYGRNEVRAFLISNALYWLEAFHFDGLRVDAVASMLYRDYSRDDGDWIPNQHGGRENLEAISFLQELNRAVTERCPGVITIAEESTAWQGVTAPPADRGLGFTFKWNMGWMNDTLAYFAKDPIYRPHHHNQLTFGITYMDSEHFILPLSHDEVVHMKGSLWNKMPGDDWQRAANVRLLLGYMFAYPGKNHLFMGGEFGQREEWDESQSLAWHTGEQHYGAGIARWVRDLGQLYRNSTPCWQEEHHAGFEWIACDDHQQSILAWRRKAVTDSKCSELLFIFNFSPVPRSNYRVGVPANGRYRELLNSDAEVYGGSNCGNWGAVQSEPIAIHNLPNSAAFTLPPLAMIVFAVET